MQGIVQDICKSSENSFFEGISSSNKVTEYRSDPETILKQIRSLFDDNKSSERELKRKGILNTMSFVAMLVHEDGLVGFADSRATKTYPDGTSKKNVRRGNIQKIFRNDDLLLLTFNLNQLMVHHQLVNIEDWINQNLEGCSKERFFKRFRKVASSDENRLFLLNSGVPKEQLGYEFIIGTKSIAPNGIKSYGCQYVVFDADGNFREDSMIFRPGFYFAGDRRFREIFENHSSMDMSLPIGILKQKYETQLHSMISFFDANDQYSSVGEPLNIIEFSDGTL